MKRLTWMSSTMAILALVAAQARAADAAAPATGAAPAAGTGATVEQIKPTGTDHAKGKKQWKPQTLCPVSGDPINKEVYTDYKRRRVYFCCQACVPKFEADPKTYLNQMRQDGVRCEPLKSVKKDHPAKTAPAGETPKSE
ncbi:MAG: YHS domain-containing protein [bacterium]